MSYNPVRAKNFYKTGRKRHKLNPHAGIKHSDIMRRQGVGQEMPVNRQVSSSGYTAQIHAGEGFAFRHELLAPGNSSGLGVNPTKDRAFHVTKGVLFLLLENDEGDKQYVQIQEGGNFVARAGMKHGYATTGTSECSFLLVEDANYADTWEQLGEGNAKQYENPLSAGSAPEAQPYVLGSGTQDQEAAPVSNRRKDQTKAKNQAAQAARRKARRQPKKGSSPVQQARAAAGAQTVTGATQVGVNSSDNANSGNVMGVNPKPSMGR